MALSSSAGASRPKRAGAQTAKASTPVHKRYINHLLVVKYVQPWAVSGVGNPPVSRCTGGYPPAGGPRLNDSKSSAQLLLIKQLVKPLAVFVAQRGAGVATVVDLGGEAALVVAAGEGGV